MKIRCLVSIFCAAFIHKAEQLFAVRNCHLQNEKHVCGVQLKTAWLPWLFG